MILYIGNFLEHHGTNPGVNRSLVEKLQQHFVVEFASQKRNKALRLLDMLSKVLRLRRRAEVVIIDVFSTDAFWFACSTAWLCRKLELPYVAILHGGNLLDRLERSPGRCRSLFSRSAATVSPSIYLKEGFEKAGYPVIYIPNFIELEQYPFKERPACQPRLLWVRSFHRIYNPTLAIDVLQQLLPAHTNAELCMVGPDKDGTLADVTSRAGQSGVDRSVTITGRLERSAWIALAGGYDIFINTTDFDNHPVSVIEAMALGLPVVSTNVGGLPFLIENGTDGILVPPRNPDAFVTAIVGLLQDPARAARLAREGRKKVEGFDWAAIRPEWLRVLGAAMRPAA